MKRIVFLLIFFALLFSYPAYYLDKSVSAVWINNKNIVWNNKELTYVVEKVKRANLNQEKVLIKKEHVLITAYTPSIWETDSTPFITASGKRISEAHVAVSRDLLSKFPFGTKVKIFIPDKNLPGCGKEVIGKSLIVRYVADTMNRRHYRKIDLVFFSRRKAINFGKCRGVIIVERL
jgi:3D (Asp-Asp-Asp) domain-containing protein